MHDARNAFGAADQRKPNNGRVDASEKIIIMNDEQNLIIFHVINFVNTLTDFNWCSLLLMQYHFFFHYPCCAVTYYCALCFVFLLIRVAVAATGVA